MTAAKIPYVNLAGQHAAIRQELLDAAGRVLDHGQFILGPEVAEFEERFAARCGVKFAVGVNSGTDALVLSLRALDIGPGDEVVTAANTFVATASAIALVGARPVLADVRDDYNIDPAAVEAAVTPKTRAVIPVHLTGRPADMDAIGGIVVRHGLAVVEDAAQAVLAEFRGRKVGTFGDFGCFSLHPLKTLNACGDGGVVVCGTEERAAKIRTMRNIGLKTRENAAAWSGNSRLDTVQAAFLIVKLAYLDEWTERRRANARFYQQALAGVPGLKVPEDRPFERAVYHTFIIQAERRDELRRHLAEQGVETAIHYPLPIHLQEAGRSLGYARGAFPVAERQAGRILSLPVYPELTREQLERVAVGIRAFYGA